MPLAAFVRPCLCAVAVILGSASSAIPAAETTSERTRATTAAAASAPKARPQDRSGRKRVGIASYYARKFAGRTMANGEPMDPRDDNAASKTLPLGTRARVTNLDNGRSATVTIEDRGPYVKGRILDVSPATARELGIGRKEGVAKVEVAPITVPQPDGSVKLGAAVTQP